MQATYGFWLYRCVSHKECPFYASFGPRSGNKKLILKNCCLHHDGFDRMGKYPDGHKLKEPITTLLTPAVDNVKQVKFGKPVANDVTKASRNLDGHTPTTKQAHKILAKNLMREREEARKSYQYIIPYIQSFRDNNPGTIIEYERDDNKAITKLFLCPGIMNTKLKYVRPILSLDAAHLSSEAKGTLYLATIKSGKDELLPIAIGITADNENYKGWKFFLENLNKSCDILTSVHTQPRCHPHKLYTFISDRDKGLKPPTTNKRQPGRPSTQRIRKKSKSENTIKCSNCGLPEHNKTTCQKPVGSKLLTEQQNSSVNNNLLTQQQNSSVNNNLQNVEHNMENNTTRNDLFAQTFAMAVNPNMPNMHYCQETQQYETQVVQKKRGRPKKNQPFERNEQSFL